jgi:hypothetical protein
VQYPVELLKTKISRTPVPIPASLAAELSAHVVEYGRHEYLLTGREGAPAVTVGGGAGNADSPQEG